MDNQTNLKEALNELTVEGVLHEKNLEIKTEDGKNMISGTISIKTSETNIVTLRVSQNEYTKAGKPNSVYAGLVTVKDEYKSVAEVGNELADKVRVTKGQINPYHNKNTNADTVGFKTNFINRVKDESTFDPKAELDVELYISSITGETSKEEETRGEETGRAIIRGWMPTYNGIEPLTFVVPEEYADDIREEYKSGDTVLISADVINSKVEKKQTIPVKIGKPKVKKITSYKNELLLTGISESYEERKENGEAVEPYNRDAIQKAIAEREIKIEEAKKDGATATQQAKPPVTSGRPMPNW